MANPEITETAKTLEGTVPYSTQTSSQAIATPQSDPSIAPIISALEDLFQQLNTRFFESVLSKPVVTVSPDPQRKNRTGWCTTRRVWSDGESEGYFESNVSAEFLNRPIDEICETLMHNMVHQLNSERGIKDTSRGGTYHNDKFGTAAEEHGLVATKSSKYGYSETDLTPEAKDFIQTLELSDFDLYRASEMPVNPESPDEDSPPRKPTSTRKYSCPKCSARVRATKDVQILCVPCGEPFVIVE